MRSVSGTECIVYIYICQRCELFGKFSVVLFFLCMETDILEQHALAALERGRFRLRILAYNILGKGYGNTEIFGKLCRDRSKGVLHVEFALRTAEMRAEYNCRAVSKQILDGRKCAADTAVVGNDAVLERYIEIAPNKNLLAAYVDILN